MSEQNHEIVFNVHGLKLTLPPLNGNVHGRVSIIPGAESIVNVVRDKHTGHITVSIDTAK